MCSFPARRCSVRNQCLRRQLRAMLDVDPDSWKPPEENAHLWLAEVMGSVVDYNFKKSPKTNDAVLEARTTVLELVIDYLVAGRRRRRRGGGRDCADDPAQRAMDFFPKKEKGERKLKTKTKKMTPKGSAESARQDAERQRQNAKIAVETSARWAVGVWGWMVSSAGVGAGGASEHRWVRRETPALVRARLLVASLLAEVVETCGLPVGESCGAILEQMISFAGVPANAPKEIGKSERNGREPAEGPGVYAIAAAPGAEEEGCRGLGAAARGGLVRALLGRPFCAELARVLRDDLVGDPPRGDVKEVDRLRALLSRVLKRAESGANALLFPRCEQGGGAGFGSLVHV